ncbi:pantetheine-phosphate adenylyltransferase [Desulfallas thermosapovorans]|uniref:Phosphopantetheine adenylyltransferase n=1 Tax=Desulfallas thermosapovorans DSM 6562 TaxID=1121431 RepID=A0A5S4ZXI8_9FIRM|nr:pantetheine-phosphate adenylyltransferase [Desulfallas thermosapovorans]TYO97403.1 phosphopantetheine adenylyltransferase [Desulfallas thermosapovorans DSM 6562]
MRIAVYPGSFDPVTNGHLDIIERAAILFDRLIVAVSLNPGKKPLFSIEERLDMLKIVTQPFYNVVVDTFDGLTVNYAKEKDAQVIIRGLRAISDFENEFMMALTNKKLQTAVETVFLMTRAEFSFISSSAVKEVASFGGCVKDLVPPVIQERLRSKFK